VTSPETTAPCIRASFVFDNVRSIEMLGPETFQRIRSLVPPATLELMDLSSRVAWLPVDVDIDWTEATDRVVGRERMRACMRDGILRATEGPLLSPVRRSVQAVLGITPTAYLRRAPTAFRAMYRDAGAVEVDAGEREVVLRYVDIPEVIARSEPYVDGIAGAIEAVMVLGGEPGGTVETRFRLASRSAEFVCRW
jgi:hypothetical protein